MKTINFYGVSYRYGEFSNFSLHPITIDDKVWPTTEHYFQAMKFNDTDYQEEIRQVDAPLRAKQLGNSRSKPLRADWESVKDDVMRKAVLAKFTQHTDLRDILLSTGEAHLVEHAKYDAYWGDGYADGKNMLGVILMEVRGQIKEK